MRSQRIRYGAAALGALAGFCLGMGVARAQSGPTNSDPGYLRLPPGYQTAPHAAAPRLPATSPAHGTSDLGGGVSKPIDVRLGGDRRATRVVLDLAQAPAERVRVSVESGRLILTAADAAPDAPTQGAGRGLVARWRLIAQGGAAVVTLDVAPGASVNRRFLLPPAVDGGAWRYVIDLNGPDAAAPVGTAPASPSPAPVASYAQVTAALKTLWASDAPVSATPAETRSAAQILAQTSAPRSPPGAPASTAPSPAPPARILARSESQGFTPHGRQKVIVIDPGHGGHDTGAQSLVRNEKDITLAAGLDLKARLERSGRYKVVMTRSTDVFIPLAGRVRIAREAKADLFISLHADSAGADPTPHGASIYTLSDQGVTRVHDVMGPQDPFAEVGGRRADPAVSQLLLDLAQRNTRNQSAEFSGILLDHISGSVDLLPRSHRDANYFVLLAPDVPAVLLEMGFITNPSDELRLTDPDERRRLMDEVGDAIDDYFSPPKQVALK